MQTDFSKGNGFKLCIYIYRLFFLDRYRPFIFEYINKYKYMFFSRIYIYILTIYKESHNVCIFYIIRGFFQALHIHARNVSKFTVGIDGTLPM